MARKQTPRCGTCGVPLEPSKGGRPRKFCSLKCKNAASYRRWAEKNVRVTVPRERLKASA